MVGRISETRKRKRKRKLVVPRDGEEEREGGKRRKRGERFREWPMFVDG